MYTTKRYIFLETQKLNFKYQYITENYQVQSILKFFKWLLVGKKEIIDKIVESMWTLPFFEHIKIQITIVRKRLFQQLYTQWSFSLSKDTIKHTWSQRIHFFVRQTHKQKMNFEDKIQIIHLTLRKKKFRM